MNARACPALLISASASGQGKTTVTAALARAYSRRGLKVRVFKCGPDFLDPTILARASGSTVYQIDLWMIGESESRRLLWEAAGEADLILVEGVMGLYDGQPSAADLACRFEIPVLTIIDAGAMAQTFAAIAHGLATYRPGLPMAGVLANRVGSVRHGEILRDCLPPSLRWFGALPRTHEAQLPSRHLGLVQASELNDLDARLDAAADALEASVSMALPEPVSFAPPALRPAAPCLAGVRIGIAHDAAFAFLYSSNVDELRRMGAELVYFSPLADETLPEVDSLYLPGGYPELHIARLAANAGMKAAIRAHHAAGKPILAECGGMLYLLDALTDKHGTSGAMVGLLPGEAHMQTRLAALALQSVTLAEGTLRGHTFHHSVLQTSVAAFARGECPNHRRVAEAVYRSGRLTASYIHFYFASDLQAAAAFFAHD
ncbi:cobyrinate a,c-diamide synthase [Pseudomonas matsuisoli]|uniref:Hydrogenobyrinate a,c-diamide synthase n=1 Tax=Pseudomonas matsuisoli TaxID=1515666 RepID=A0A917UVX1_9PSED|nr:cobyrinate a,c-diamide synthase [Pseudomonas matsuisoli]GGJ90378.1 hydrogenobyrinate a,c-diamide synthase [Pseudomonas matsuisoli]